MFKLAASPTFKAQVQLTAAGSEPQTVEFTFRHKGRKAMMVWLDRVMEIKDEAQELACVMEIVDGWAVADDDGDPLPVTEASMLELLDSHQTAGGEIVRAYRKALTESRAKN